MGRKKFNKEFKLGAIKLAQESGKNMKTVAEELGISDTALRNWIRLYSDKAAPTQRKPHTRKECQQPG